MSSAVEVRVDIQPESVAVHRNVPPARLWSRLALAIVTLISIFMNFYQLGQNGLSQFSLPDENFPIFLQFASHDYPLS
jgi:hypothetical protein